MQPRSEYASFGSRLLAFLLDTIITTILSYIGGFFIGIIIGIFARVIRLSEDQMISFAFFSGMVIGIVIGWLYYAYQESSPKQATLGKQAMNIAVTDLNGNRISFARATGRYFGKILSGSTFGIGYLIAAFTEKKQALHDILAGTLVVSTKR